MDMIRSRNETSHNYDGEVADNVVKKVTEEYFPQMQSFFQYLFYFLCTPFVLTMSKRYVSLATMAPLADRPKGSVFPLLNMSERP